MEGRSPPPPFAAYAQRYAAIGFTVMPLKPLSNVPHWMLGTGWTFCAKCGGDRPQVGGRLNYWDEDPTANLGIVTGAPSRLLVIDVDTHRGNGPEEWTDWCYLQKLVGNVMPPYPTVSTPGGGFHHYFRLADDQHVKSNLTWMQNIEAKACGGQVAAPPSARRVGPLVAFYAIASAIRTIPPAPAFLVSSVATEHARRRYTGSASVSVNGSLPDTQYFLDNGFTPGARDEEAYRLSCRLIRKGLTIETVTTLIHVAWSKTPPVPDQYPWSRCLKKIDGARRWCDEQTKNEKEMADDLNTQVCTGDRGGSESKPR